MGNLISASFHQFAAQNIQLLFTSRQYMPAGVLSSANDMFSNIFLSYLKQNEDKRQKAYCDREENQNFKSVAKPPG